MTNSPCSPETAEQLASILVRCRTVLGNMALENESGLAGVFNRWPISHEPLRADAKNLVPLIDEALAAHHKAFLKGMNDYHDHHPPDLAQTPAGYPDPEDEIVSLKLTIQGIRESADLAIAELRHKLKQRDEQLALSQSHSRPLRGAE